MNFGDIDFSKVAQILNGMSPEEKQRMSEMAQDMMKNMNQNQEAAAQEEETDFYEFLGITEDDYADVPGIVLDEIEQAVEMEQYYEDVQDSDFSASALFYGKALLNMCRKYQYPVFSNLFDGFKNPNTTTLYSYLYPLMNDENIQKLSDEGFGSQNEWVQIRLMLQQMYVVVNRAEYDQISYEDIQNVKSILFNQNGLLLMKECI